MTGRIAVLIAVVVALFSFSACGSSSDSPEPGTQAQPVKKVEINVEGNTITPVGERVLVKVGQPIQFIVTADTAGEIHMHSDPEKELSYNKGTTILEVGSFDRTGVIEVESHDLHKTIIQLQVQ